MIAVIDCGTNTFNLLIGKVVNQTLIEVIYNGKIPVKLGEGGIDKGILSVKAFERGLNAICEFSKKINEFQVEKTIAIGTAAIRDASNGNEFINACKSKTGIKIELIDGNREAELIWFAAKNCVETYGKFLIMDIGGGSNEFVIADNEKIYWKKSYRLGLSRLKETFMLDEGNSIKKIELIQKLVLTAMSDLFENCKIHKISHLIGTAGTFDTYANVFSIRKTGNDFDFSNRTFEFNSNELLHFCGELIESPLEKRNAIEGIPDFRKEFMIYACLLTKVVMENCGIEKCSLSSYALKEGVMLSYCC